MAKAKAKSTGSAIAPAPGEVAKVWAGGKLPSAVLLIGAETAIREEALKGIRQAAFGNSDGGMNWVIYHGPQNQQEPNALDPATVLDEVCTRPMFGAPDEQKVVVVRQADLFVNAHREILERNIPRIPDRTTMVIEVAQPGTFKNTRLYKLFAEGGAAIDCAPLESRDFGGGDAPLNVEVERRARALGLDLDHAAVTALLDRSSHTLGVLLEELAKLALALGADDEKRVHVTAKDVAEVCARTRLVDPFEFADAVGERDLKRALETLGAIAAHGLGDYKRPGRVVTNENEITMRLLAAVTYKLTQLQDLRAAIDARIPEFEAFKAAKLFGFRQEGAQRALRKHTTASLREAMEALLRANLELRSSQGKMEVMERMAWSVCRGLSRAQA
jgi:DNA polymerase III delta subunit